MQLRTVVAGTLRNGVRFNHRASSVRDVIASMVARFHSTSVYHEQDSRALPVGSVNCSSEAVTEPRHGNVCVEDVFVLCLQAMGHVDLQRLHHVCQ